MISPGAVTVKTELTQEPGKPAQLTSANYYTVIHTLSRKPVLTLWI